MIKVGKKNNKGNIKYTMKASSRKKPGIIRTSLIIFLAFVICMLLANTLPVNAIVVDGTDTVSTTDQPASCPCKSQSSTPQVSSDIATVAADAGALDQLIQSTYTPADTTQQAIDYATQSGTIPETSNGANVNSIEPILVQDNAGTTEATGMTADAGFGNLFSQWINKGTDSDISGYSFGNMMNDQMFNANPLSTSWQMSPINAFDMPTQLNWLNKFM